MPAVSGTSLSLFSFQSQYHRWSLCVKVKGTLIEETRNHQDLLKAGVSGNKYLHNVEIHGAVHLDLKS